MTMWRDPRRTDDGPAMNVTELFINLMGIGDPETMASLPLVIEYDDVGLRRRGIVTGLRRDGDVIALMVEDEP